MTQKVLLNSCLSVNISKRVLRWTDAIDMSKPQHHCIDSSIPLTPPFFHCHHSSRLVINMMPPVTRGHKLTPRSIEQTYIETSLTILCQLFTRSRDIWDINWIREGHSLLWWFLTIYWPCFTIPYYQESNPPDLEGLYQIYILWMCSKVCWNTNAGGYKG